MPRVRVLKKGWEITYSVINPIHSQYGYNFVYTFRTECVKKQTAMNRFYAMLGCNYRRSSYHIYGNPDIDNVERLQTINIKEIKPKQWTNTRWIWDSVRAEKIVNEGKGEYM